MKLHSKKLLKVVTGSYIKEGQEKKVYRTIGEQRIMQKEDNSYVSFFELYHMPGAQISAWDIEEQEKGGLMEGSREVNISI